MHWTDKRIGPKDGWTPEMTAAKEKALGPNPHGGYNHSSLGCEFFRVRMWAHAINEFEQAVEINPWEPRFKVFLARAYLAAGEFDQALQLSEAALAQAPEFPEALLAMALTLERMGETDKGAEWFKKCLA